MFNEQLFGYAKDKNVFGDIAEISFLKGTIVLEDENGELHTFKQDDVVLLNHIVDIGEMPVYEHDVLGTVNGNMYEIVKVENENRFQLHQLDKKFKRINTSSIHDKSFIEGLENDVTLLGNIFQLKANLKTVDFNIKIVKEVTNAGITYFYACNNKEKEEVDLIKVIFLGHQLLKEEDYARVTFSHDEYLDLVDKGILKEVNPNELLNYVTGATYGKSYEEVEPCCDDDENYDVELEVYDEDDDVCDCDLCRTQREDEKEDEENEEDSLW